MENEMNTDRCPKCGKFVENNADGFYDTDEPGKSPDDGANIVVFCDADCAHEFHKEARLRPFNLGTNRTYVPTHGMIWITPPLN